MSVLIVGYGTLLNTGSLAQAIGDSTAEGKSYLPVVVRNYRRLFNLRPEHYETSSKISQKPIEMAAMNVEPAAGQRFNGLAFYTKPEELASLDERERYYERHVVEIFSFETNEMIGEGYTYVVPLDSKLLSRDLAELLPRWKDIELAREGAYRISTTFGKMFDDTTFLADGETLMSDYYKEHLVDYSEGGQSN